MRVSMGGAGVGFCEKVMCVAKMVMTIESVGANIFFDNDGSEIVIILFF
jgi:hypothetical protein